MFFFCNFFKQKLLAKTLTTTIIILSFNTIAYNQTKKVLFLGNSYTSVNDLPLTLYKLAISKGDTLIYDSNTPGGYTFNAHSTNSTSLAKIQADNWDFVVLQEQSQIPSFPPSQVATDCLPYAAILVDSIKSNYSCSEPLFYMTWGRKYGDAGNCAVWPPVCTYEGMQWRLRWGYMQMAADNNASVAPVGLAWYNSITANDTLDLYATDYSHPSIYGTYLTACVFYATIFRKNPVGLTNHNIDQNTANFLQSIAKQTVFNTDTIQAYFGYGNIPFANFLWTNTGNNTIQFNNTSLNGTLYLWNFGDGTTDTVENPVHIYQNQGTYQVSLTVGSSCQSTTVVIDTITASVSTKINNTGKNNIKIYPNPAGNVLNVHCNKNSYNIEIYNTQGQLIIAVNKVNSNNTQIDVSSLEKGIYVLKIKEELNILTTKIVID